MTWLDRLRGRSRDGASPAIRTLSRGEFRVDVDPRGQVLSLDIPPDVDTHDDYTRPEPPPFSPPLAARLSDVGRHGSFVSASMLALKAKQFDDGLVAAVELAATRGTPALGGKAQMLAALLQQIAATPSLVADTAARTVAAAAALGGALVPDSMSDSIRATIDAFDRDDLRSKPLAFYTWTPELERIFRRDRMLQEELRPGAGLSWLARTIAADAALRATYERHLALAARLTGPRAGDSLLACMSGSTSAATFFPASTSHETDLAKRLYGARSIPDGFNLGIALIDAIRNGTIDFTPNAASGWYGWQTWALEPLVVPERAPEAARLRLGNGYRRQLLDLFKAILALTRETHVKQLELPRVGMAFPPPVVLTPGLSVEPLAEYYVRRAAGYRVVRELLEEILGASALASIHGRTPEGERTTPLAEELHEMEDLFGGAYRTVCLETGAPPNDSVPGAPDSARLFQAWAAHTGADEDLGRDARMMVPVFHDVERRRTKVWALLGWVERPLHVDFAVNPRVTVFDARGRDVTSSTEIEFRGEMHSLVYPVTEERYVDRLLNRDEFRAVCDEHRTADRILAALGGAAV